MNLRSTLRWTVSAATLVAAGFASTTFLSGSVMPTLACPANLSTTLTFSEGDFPPVQPLGTPRYSTPQHLPPTGGTVLTNQFQSAGVTFSASSPLQAWTYLAAQPDPSAEKILSPSEGVLLSSIMLGANPGNTTITTTVRFVNPANGSAITARGSSIGLWAYGRGPGPLTFKSYDAAGALIETKTIPGADGTQVFGTVQFTTGDVARIEAVNTGLPQQGLAIDDLQYALNLNCPAQPQSSSSAPLQPSSSAVAGVQCGDGADNDGDGLTDFPQDLGCHAANDTDEQNPTVDIKINGQNSVLTVAAGTQVTLSWTSTDAARCNTGTSPAPWGPYTTKATSGSEQVTVTQSMTFGMHCAETATSGMVAQDADVGVTVTSPTSSAPNTCGNGICESNEKAFVVDCVPGSPSCDWIACPADCIASSTASSAPANCNDGIDNDGDGFVDGLKTAAVQRRAFSTADAVRDAVNGLGGARVPSSVLSMEFGCGGYGNDDAGFCAGLGYDGYEAAVCAYSACGAGGTPKVEANAYWNGPQVIRDDCNTWYVKNHTTWHNYLSSVTCLDKAACGDGKDNDFDGKVDMQDTGCANADDDSEVQHDTSCDTGTSEGATQANECADGIDNDGDGKIDRTQTSSLSTRLFTSPGEIAAAINALGSARVPTPLQSMEFGCGSNGLGAASDGGFCGLLGYGMKTSNCLYSACGAGGEPKVTGNGYISGTRVLREDCNGWYTHAHTTWHNYLHAAECVTGTQCSDGIDNDGDGLIDHPADIGCASANDTSEVEADPECATGSTERATATSSSQNAQCQISYSGYCGAAGCPKALVGYQNKTYLRYETAAGSWQAARTACQAAGGDLVSVNTAGEQTAIFDGLVGDRHDLWIGLSDIDTEGTFRWTDGTSPTYANWYPNQPDNGSSNEDCVEMNYMNYAKNGKWNDFRCSDGEGQNTGFICEIARNCGTSQPPASSRPAKYSLHTSPNLLSWCDAQQACAQLGQNLATITNETELNAAFTAAGNTENVWIGLNDAKTEGKYVWVSGEPFKSSHGFWTGGQPNGEGLPWNDCTMLNHGRSGKYWHDVGCDGEGFVKSYLCEDAVRSGTPPVIPGCDAASRILSCSAGGFTGPTVTALRGTPDQPLQLSLIEDFYGLQIAAGQGTTMTMAAPTGKEFKAFPMVAKLDGASPTVRIRFVNPETGGRITVPGNTLRILVGRFDATASGTIIGKSYDFTGQLVEDLRSKSQQAFLTFTEWHIAEVELSATGLNSFYFNNMGYGPLECTPFTEAYVRPSSSSRTSSSRASVRSSSLASSVRFSSLSTSSVSVRSSAKTSGNSSLSSLRSASSSKLSALSGKSSSKASTLPTSSVRNTLASQGSVTSVRQQGTLSSARFSLPSINLPPGTSSLSNEQLRDILSLQFPQIPVDSFFPLPDDFWEGKENPDGVTLDISQAGRAKSSSSAIATLATSWLDEWLPWREAAPEEVSSSSIAEAASTSEPAAIGPSSAASATSTTMPDTLSSQGMPARQPSSAAPVPPSSDEQDGETVAPVTLSQDGMPLWWWIVLIVGAILGLLLGMYVTNRLLAPKEE